MPNWCSNVFTVMHSDSAMIDRFIKGFEMNKLLGEFIPMPDELMQSPRNLPSDVAEENIRKFGSPDWHAWAGVHWGTKWDVGEESGAIKRVDDNTVTGSFHSAWCAPRAAFKTLGEMGFVYTVVHSDPMTDYAAVSDNDGYQSFDSDFYVFELKGVDWREVIPKSAHSVVEFWYSSYLEQKAEGYIVTSLLPEFGQEA